LGRGNTHQEGRYKKEVDRGIKFLVDLAAKGNGNMAQVTWPKPKYERGFASGYSQAVAAMALAEAYGMTKDEKLLVPAQAAIDCVTDWQDPRHGGWGYRPRSTATTSISCMNFLALKTGQLAGLQVNPASFQLFGGWLDSCSFNDGAGYSYTPKEKLNNPKALLKTTCTAQGLLCRMYLGWKKNNSTLQRGITEALVNRGPEKQGFYYNYYATQVMYQVQGPAWDAWNAQLKGILLQSQGTVGHETGSWHSNRDPGFSYGGRLYVTAMATMTLEVYYRHMAIYGDQATAGGFKD